MLAVGCITASSSQHHLTSAAASEAHRPRLAQVLTALSIYSDFKPIVIQTVKGVVFLPVPCVPNNMSVLPSCDDNGATVTWSSSLVATSYLLTATGRDGHVAVCNSTENNCTLTHLHCGQPYSLSVTASGDKCTSQPSFSSFRTGKVTLPSTLGLLGLPLVLF